MIVFFVESAIMLIPAIIEAILALAAGSIAGVGKAIEKGLSMLLPLVINLFAKLIGLGGLAKRVMKIFKKIRKRIDKAVNKILAKAKKAGRKLMAKLGFGKKTKNKKGEEVKHDPAKQKKIDAGMADLHKKEKEIGGSDKKITREQAGKIATKIKSGHKVFSSFKVVDGKDSWDYAYTASPQVIVEGLGKEGNQSVTFKKGQLVKTKFTDGMWIAEIASIDELEESLDIKFLDNRKGTKKFTFKDVNIAAKKGDFISYEKRSNRDYYMGGNPSRDSGFGTKLKNKWRTTGPIASVSNPVSGSFNDSVGERIWWKGKWLPIAATDLGHFPKDAVTYWNETGYKAGPRAPEVREWMNDHNNYRFEESSYNRSKGASSGERYRLPLKDE